MLVLQNIVFPWYNIVVLDKKYVAITFCLFVFRLRQTLGSQFKQELKHIIIKNLEKFKVIVSNNQ